MASYVEHEVEAGAIGGSMGFRVSNKLGYHFGRLYSKDCCVLESSRVLPFMETTTS